MNKGELLIKNVCFDWNDTENGVKVFDNLNLHIKSGEFLCILGPSGCGKTTLLHLIAGFRRPVDGEIFVSGKKVGKPGSDRAMVFQHSALFPWLTVADNIGYGMKSDENTYKINELLKLIGLENFKNTYPHQLSGGMRQKVSLARALALEPDVLLMDEPFAALDTFNREKLQDELLSVRFSTGCTIVFVTHNIQEAAYLSDRTVVLSKPPSKINLDLAIEIPFPRRRIAPELWRMSQRLYASCGCCSELNGNRCK